MFIHSKNIYQVPTMSGTLMAVTGNQKQRPARAHRAGLTWELQLLPKSNGWRLKCFGRRDRCDQMCILKEFLWLQHEEHIGAAGMGMEAIGGTHGNQVGHGSGHMD